MTEINAEMPLLSADADESFALLAHADVNRRMDERGDDR